MNLFRKSEYEKQKIRQEKWRCKAGRGIEDKAWSLMNAEYSDRMQMQSFRQETLDRYFKFIIKSHLISLSAVSKKLVPKNGKMRKNGTPKTLKLLLKKGNKICQK